MIRMINFVERIANILIQIGNLVENSVLCSVKNLLHQIENFSVKNKA